MTGIGNISGSGYVPAELSGYSGTNASSYYSPSFSAEASDSFATSNQESTKKKNKTLLWLGAAGVGILAVLGRKKLPFVGKFFEEGGGGLKKMGEEVTNAAKGVFKGEKAEIKSFVEHDEAIKAAQKNLDDVVKNPRSCTEDKRLAEEALEAAKKAKDATHDVYKADIGSAIKEKNEFMAAGKYSAEDLKAYNTKIENTKSAYLDALMEDKHMTKSQAQSKLKSVMGGINTEISSDKKSSESVMKAVKSFTTNKDKTGYTNALRDRVEYLCQQLKNQKGDKLTPEDVKGIRQQVADEFRIAHSEIKNAAKDAKASA